MITLTTRVIILRERLASSLQLQKDYQSFISIWFGLGCWKNDVCKEKTGTCDGGCDHVSLFNL